MREAAEAPPPQAPEAYGHHIDGTTGEDDFGEGFGESQVAVLADNRVVAAEKRDPKNPTTWGKIGRNEACPCGSGKKYKHCHGAFV